MSLGLQSGSCDTCEHCRGLICVLPLRHVEQLTKRGLQRLAESANDAMTARREKVSLHLRIAPETDARLRAQAEILGRELSEVVESALLTYLNAEPSVDDAWKIYCETMARKFAVADEQARALLLEQSISEKVFKSGDFGHAHALVLQHHGLDFLDLKLLPPRSPQGEGV